ncbi:hypothetical protein TNCV_200441 [Trichonephila clavipes]|nr:hypothetical protein TNCV_200441 [Trichonephila clavipes]
MGGMAMSRNFFWMCDEGILGAKSHVSKNDAMDENEEKSVLAGDQKPKLLFKNPKERGFRNGVRDAENTCIHTKA